MTRVVGRSAWKKTWSCDHYTRECWSGGQRDMEAMGIKEEMAQDHCAWRNITGGPLMHR